MINKKVIKLYKDVKKIDFFKLIDKSFIVKALAPNLESHSYRNTLKYLNKANFKHSVERYYSYRLLIMILSLIILLCLNSYSVFLKNKEIIYGNKYTSDIIGFTNIDSSVAAMSSDPKRLIIVKIAESIDYKKLIKSDQLQQIATAIKQIEKDNNIQDDNNKIAKDVLNDLMKAASNGTSVFAVLLILALSVFSGKIVNYYLYVKSLLRDAKIESEVDKLEYHAVILIKGSKMSVENILIRLRDYSNYLKPYFNKCLAEYPVEHLLAIDNLINEVDNVYFTKFISLIQQNLITDRDTNIKLLETQKDINFVLSEEKRRGKILKTSRLYSEISIPIYIFAVFQIILPLFKYINGLF